MDISNIWVGSAGFSLKHVLRIVAAALVLAALGLAYGGWLFERDLTTMKSQGVEAIATVTRGRDDVNYRYQNRYDLSDGAHHTYYLALTWTDSDGRVRTFTRQVSSGLFFSMANDASPEGQQIPIRYLPRAPGVQPFIATEIDDTFNGYLYGAIGVFLLGLGAGWFGWPPRRTNTAAAA